MTAPRRDRRYAVPPFSVWLRAQTALDSVRESVTAHDIDLHVHRYRTGRDSYGPRAVHCMMQVEVKSFGKIPDPNQRQTLFFCHQLLNDKRQKLRDSKSGGRISLWSFGGFVLSMSAACPDTSEWMRWHRFDGRGRLVPTPIDRATLIGLLGFKLRPDTLKPLDLRRHHKTEELLERETVPLGFDTLRKVTRRS